MHAIILGDGGFGRAIARTLEEGDEPRPTVLGRPASGRHDPRTLARADVVFDASRGDLFLRLVDEAGRLAAAIGGFEPSVLEWHRRSKEDRPSGTAREIVRRLAVQLPIDVDEVAVLRSGAMPGMHVVGLDGTSETIELRLTARDRSGYAAGALAAIDWLAAAPRTPGIHAFDEVIDERIASGRRSGRANPEPVSATA